MKPKVLDSTPPRIHYQNSASQDGHIMWYQGKPFVAWNCESQCMKRLRTPIDDYNGQCTCGQCGALYKVDMEHTGSVTVRQIAH